ncbi:uncharacterized protein LOC115994089 [Quercus lobata]|uniref:uncharacterized protein LOC115994089 n=1 Tax=Quercus lobata TaxID=97700 RepID=UPI001247B995|nr:uncharacterized protein LOC115994089 [Quercus lobata]
MRAMQIFRVTLNFIATAKIWNSGLYFRREGQKGISQEERILYKEAFPVVICDPSAPFNMSFRIPRIGFIELQDEAALTLKCIEKCRDGGFEEIFMTKVDSAAKYDYCVRYYFR